MKRLSKAVLAVAVAAAAQRADFEPRPASSYACRQTSEAVTIAIEPFERGEKVKQAFGKTNLEKLGILPMLVVIANDGDQAVQLGSMRVQWITADGQKIEPTPADQVHRGGPVPTPELGPRLGGRRKPPGPSLELSRREFAAPVVAARSGVYGFFYFRTGKGPDRMAGSRLYITGLRNAATRKDLLYFEISLEPYARGL